MFLLKVFFFVSITFYSVSTKYNSWFKKENSDTSKLLEVKIPENFNNERRPFLTALFELKENGIARKFEDDLDHTYRKIDLNKLKIDDIEPGAFKTMNYFNRLELSENKLKKIKNGIFNNLKDLEYLDLNFNEISTIEEEAFDNMPDIIRIFLTGNKIVKLNENWFKNSTGLKEILFDHNEIEEISADSLKNLRGVHMSAGKPIGVDLYFGYNKINKIHPNVFNRIPLIRSLNLRKNLLKSLPEKLFEGVIVEECDIGENYISCTPKEVFNATKGFTLNPPMCT